MLMYVDAKKNHALHGFFTLVTDNVLKLIKTLQFQTNSKAKYRI